TGNYGFFNLLTAVLNLWILDDELLRRSLPGPVWDRLPRAAPSPQPHGWRRAAALVLAVPFGAASVSLFAHRLRTGISRLPQRPGLVRGIAGLGGRIFAGLRRLEGTALRLRLMAPYGLFSVMTTTRPEIVIEGSND